MALPDGAEADLEHRRPNGPGREADLGALAALDDLEPGERRQRHLHGHW